MAVIKPRITAKEIVFLMGNILHFLAEMLYTVQDYEGIDST